MDGAPASVSVPRRLAPILRRFRFELWLFGAFVAGDLVFSSISNLIAHLLQGVPYLPAQPPAAGPNLLDAVWHLATGLLFALPMRERRALLVVPALTLLLDVDHLFGAVLPVAVPRPAHDLLFFALLAAGLLPTLGRRAMALAVGASLLHVGVDGGTFPLFAPASPASFGLTFPEQLAFLAAAALALAVAAAGRPAPHTSRSALARYAPWVLAVVALGITLGMVGPAFGAFTRA